jgi:hypothetical protein
VAGLVAWLAGHADVGVVVVVVVVRLVHHAVGGVAAGRARVVEAVVAAALRLAVGAAGGRVGDLVRAQQAEWVEAADRGRRVRWRVSAENGLGER